MKISSEICETEHNLSSKAENTDSQVILLAIILEKAIITTVVSYRCLSKTEIRCFPHLYHKPNVQRNASV